MTNNRRPTRRQVAEQGQNLPAFPEGPPDSRWSNDELLAYLQTQDAEIAALEPASPTLPLEALADRELLELARALTRETAQTIESRIRARLKKGKIK